MNIDGYPSGDHEPQVLRYDPNRRLLPPLSALAAFEAAARIGSFTKAATELNLTQGAISRQVKALEAQLGVALFDRVRQRIVLTEAGRFYSAKVRETLENITSATAQTIAFRGHGGILNLGTLPTFGTRWLIPRLPDFIAQHRDVTLNFATRLRPFNFRREGLDAAIHFGSAHWPGAVMHRLMGEELVPVAAPELIDRLALDQPVSLSKTTLLVQATRPNAWGEWFSANDIPLDRAQATLTFEQFAMVLQAAVAGLGVAIVPRVLSREELEKGDLVELFGRPAVSSEGYFLVYPSEKASYPPLVAFREWLLRQVPAPD